jgi:hypothetical protein
MPMSKFSKYSAALPLSTQKNLPIPFVPKVKNMDKVNGPDADKSKCIKLEFLMETGNAASNYSQNFAFFKDGFPEKWIKC